MKRDPFTGRLGNKDLEVVFNFDFLSKVRSCIYQIKYMNMKCLQPFSSDIITHLIHLSDIHIRLDCTFEREYSHVFQNAIIEIQSLVNQVKTKSAIIITGDFFHVKDRLSPTAENLAVTFLKSLSQIAQVILILGNHDVIIQNSEVILDTISSVLFERESLHIVYLKKSGVYRFKNLILVHNSVLDATVENWIHVNNEWKENDQDRIIHLYHGQVESCVVDNGFRLSSPIKISHFKGADATLLGDIHCHQFLAPTVAYAGSLLCQNIGESVYSHGFISWNLANQETKFIRISNQYQPIRVDILKSHHIRYRQMDFPTLEKLVLKFKKHGTIKKTQNVVIYVYPDVNISDFEIRKIFEEHLSQSVSIKHQYSNKPLNRISFKEPDTTKSSLIEKQLEDFITSRSSNLQQPSSYYLGLIMDHWDQSKANVDNTHSVNDIQFKSLSFSHMFGYGKDNTIHFNGIPTKPMIRMISGKNSVGKSTIIDILTFVLFNRITRYASGNKIPKEIIHEKQSSASVTLVFYHGNDKYEISKHIQRSKPIKMCLKKNDENITQAVRQTTEKIILSIFGTFECFINSYICLQRQGGKSFKDKTPREQKDELFQLFQVDKFELIYKKFNEEYQKSCTNGLLTETAINSCPHHSEKDIMLMKYSKDSLSQNYKDSNAKMSALEVQIHDINNIKANIKLFENQVRDLQLKKQRYEKYCDSKDAMMLSPIELQDRISKLEWNLREYMNELSSNNRIIKKTIIQVDELVHIKDFNFDFSFYNKKYKGNNNNNYNGTFPFSISYPEDDDKINKYISSYNDELNMYESEIFPIFEKCLELYYEHSKLIDKHTFLKEQMNLHETAQYNDKCDCCITNPFRKQKVELSSQIVMNKERLSKVVKEFEKNQDIIKINIQNHIFLEGYDVITIVDFKPSVVSRYKTQIQKYALKLSSLQSVYECYRQNFKTFISDRCKIIGITHRNIFLEKSIRNIKPDLENYKKQILISKEYEMFKNISITDLEKDIQNLQNEINVLYSKIKHENMTIIELNNEKKYNKTIVEDCTKIEIKLEEAIKNNEKWKILHNEWTQIDEKKKDWKVLKDICHVDGFPLFFIKNSLTMLEKDMNMVIENFIDRKVRFEYENDILIFQTKCHDNKDGLNYYGGMESFMLDIAIKIVFSKYAQISKPSLFILDENISVMDEERLRNIDSLFDFLRRFFSDILIISHQPFLLNVVDDVMTIDKNDQGYSKIS